ncbi:MAG: methyl-accepting chemotaxis protein [Rhodospirillales bacterium]|nr:methyl-accepting chemotaxis protein [Rhodospirillales bacterium]
MLRSISTRLVIAIALVATLGCAATSLLAWRQQTAQADAALERELAMQWQNVTAALEYEGRAALMVGTALGAFPQVRDAIARDDRARLLEFLTPSNNALKPLGGGLISFFKGSIIYGRVHAPEAFGDDTKGRRRNVPLAYERKSAVAGAEPGRDNFSVFATSPIALPDGSVAMIDVGFPFGAPLAERLKARFGFDSAIHRIAGDKMETLANTGRATATLDDVKRALAGETITREVVLGGRDTSVRIAALRNAANEPVGVFELTIDASKVRAAAREAAMQLALSALAVLVVALAIAWWIGRSLSRPVTSLTDTMNALAAGNTGIDVRGRDRADELGAMARAVEVFRTAMREAETLRAEEGARAEQAETQKRLALAAMADKFEAEVTGAVGAVDAAARSMRDSAGAIHNATGDASQRTTAAAAATEEASVSVQTVAAAAEQLAASIAEIGRQVEQSATVATEAVGTARGTRSTVDTLDQAARRIGDVVKLIGDVAGQTNLLALNATIEAARAGDAGKGFAVVASEVKTLAGQTAKATDEIAEQISAIQAATRECVSSIAGVADTIEKLHQISATIAAAVEEQGAATREIARNVQEAAHGTSEVALNVAAADRAAVESTRVANDVLAASDLLDAQAGTLRRQVGSFLEALRKSA